MDQQGCCRGQQNWADICKQQETGQKCSMKLCMLHKSGEISDVDQSLLCLNLRSRCRRIYDAKLVVIFTSLTKMKLCKQLACMEFWHASIIFPVNHATLILPWNAYLLALSQAHAEGIAARSVYPYFFDTCYKCLPPMQ